MKPTEALALAEALTKAAREAIEQGRPYDPLPADAIGAQTHQALDALRAAIAARD